jgi:hypothetical protein
MDKIDQGLKDLLIEIVRLIKEALDKGMEDEALRGKLIDAKRRMLEIYGRAIDVIAVNFEIMTTPVPGRKENSESELSLRFRFGSSEEDQEMGKKLGLDEGEMNNLLEEARREWDGAVNLPGMKPPAERGETAKSVDLRNIEQITSSIEKIAEALNFDQRRFLIGLIKGSKALRSSANITDSQMEDNNAWLEWIQGLFEIIKNFERPEDQTREALLALETLFKIALRFGMI